VITASRPEFGDYQANGVMRLAKQLKINPRELANQIIDELNNHKDNIVERYELAGPGFINIFLRNEEILKRANRITNKEVPLVPKSEKCLKITVDYSSPNLAKEMHVGHLRGTIIGDAIVRILEKKGHKVIRQNHVGDWGTQFGMLICYMKELQSSAEEDLPKALSDLEKFYQVAKKRFDVDDEFAVNARKEVVHLQSGNKNSIQIWEQFINESLNHCDEIYAKLNVTLTRSHLDAESKYNDALPGIISQLESRGLLSESKGAKCVFLPQFLGKDGDSLPVIVQKSDGGYLYSTTDLAAIDYKCQELDINRALYVVDARQSLHFQQVFAVAEKANLASDKISLEHIAYGTMMDSSGKPFKTRSGGTTKLIELLDESVSRAYALVTEKNPELDEKERLKIAEKVGIGSVKYADLSKNRTSDYIFDWSTMLSFEGNTAPYLMYAYARIKSILAKASGEKRYTLITILESSEERLLLIKLLQFPEIIDSVALDCFPNQLCNYLHELAGLFMRFYEACPILKAKDALQDSRLSLAEFTSLTLKEGLDLLGIETLEKM
tara:strand:- start:2003 stop:3661 length:1659 start_codon:yes stop_codon:yes gene_type:complete